MYEMQSRRRIVDAARRWIGTPYRHQAALRGVGCACLGFVRGVWREVEGTEPETPPPYASDWAESGRGEDMLAASLRHFRPGSGDGCRAGDLLLFRMKPKAPVRHCGIALGGGVFVHAYQNNAVVETRLAGFWRDRLALHLTFPSVHDRIV